MSLDIRSLVNQYEFSCKLPGSGQEVKFKPLTTGQIKYLLTFEGTQDPALIEDAIDEIIKSCVISEGFDITDLYLQDRFFLLVEIRKKTKGSEYSFTYKCPICNKENIVSLSLDSMDIREPKELSTVIDVNDNLKCNVVIPKRIDYKRAFASIDKNETSEMKRSFDLSLRVVAESIRGFISGGEVVEASIEDKIYVIENTPDTFLTKIKKWQEDNDFGIDFTYSYKCECGFTRKTEVPVTDFFI